MVEGLNKLRTGDFNGLTDEEQPDGSHIITLSSRKYEQVYVFRVKNLYEKDEQLLDIETGRPLK